MKKKPEKRCKVCGQNFKTEFAGITVCIACTTSHVLEQGEHPEDYETLVTLEYRSHRPDDLI